MKILNFICLFSLITFSFQCAMYANNQIQDFRMVDEINIQLVNFKHRCHKCLTLLTQNTNTDQLNNNSSYQYKICDPTDKFQRFSLLPVDKNLAEKTFIIKSENQNWRAQYLQYPGPNEYERRVMLLLSVSDVGEHIIASDYYGECLEFKSVATPLYLTDMFKPCDHDGCFKTEQRFVVYKGGYVQYTFPVEGYLLHKTTSLALTTVLTTYVTEIAVLRRMPDNSLFKTIANLGTSNFFTVEIPKGIYWIEITFKDAGYAYTYTESTSPKKEITGCLELGQQYGFNFKLQNNP